jgi:hypothetical protein
MQRTNTIANPDNFLPSEVSPEFLEWLTNEKADAVRHQRRILKATLMIAFAMLLFLLKEQSHWVAGMLSLDTFVAR